MNNPSSTNLRTEVTENQEKKVGSKLQDFKVISELGRGSYGVVNKVLSLVDNEVYVMKKINMKHIKIKHQKEALKEAQILKRVRHPNIIRYYNSFVEEDYLFIIMEYAEGGDLAVLIKHYREQRKTFTEREIWDFSWELCQAVDYLHTNNIIHRDIKPLNIFLSKDRKVKLGDLGVSKIVSNAASLQGTRVGTPLYLSPELVKQLPYDFKVDIWALGCVLYHLVALEPPFHGDNLITLGYNIVHKYPKALPAHPKLAQLIMRFLEKNSNARPRISDVIEFFPSRYRNSTLVSSTTKITTNNTEGDTKNQIVELSSPHGSKTELRAVAVDRIDSYKGNSAKILQVYPAEEKKTRSQTDREMSPSKSSKQRNHKSSSVTQIDEQVKHHTKGSGSKKDFKDHQSPNIRHKGGHNYSEPDISNINKNNNTDNGKNNDEKPFNQSTEEYSELRRHGNKKITDTESTVENKPKVHQNLSSNPQGGGNDTTLSAKNTKENENIKRYKTKGQNIIIEENIGQDRKITGEENVKTSQGVSQQQQQQLSQQQAIRSNEKHRQESGLLPEKNQSSNKEGQRTFVGNSNVSSNFHSPKANVNVRQSFNSSADENQAITPSNKQEQQKYMRPMTSEAPRKVGLTPMIKSTSPRIPVKAKVANVYGGGFYQNLYKEQKRKTPQPNSQNENENQELKKLDFKSQQQQLHQLEDHQQQQKDQEKVYGAPKINNQPAIHNYQSAPLDIRIRPVSANLIKRSNPFDKNDIDLYDIRREMSPNLLEKKLEPQRNFVRQQQQYNPFEDKVSEYGNGNFKKGSNNKPIGIERPRSAVFLSRLQSQIQKQMNNAPPKSIKVNDLIKNQQFASPGSTANNDKIMPVINSGQGFSSKTRVNPSRIMSAKPTTTSKIREDNYDKQVDSSFDYLFSDDTRDPTTQKEKKNFNQKASASSQQWLRFEFIGQRKSDKILGQNNKVEQPPPLTRPEINRPQTSTGSKRKVTVHDLI